MVETQAAVDRTQYLIIKHESGGSTSVSPEGKVIVFDRTLGMLGLASGEPPRLIKGMKEEQIAEILPHLDPETRQSVVDHLFGEVDDQSVGSSD